MQLMQTVLELVREFVDLYPWSLLYVKNGHVSCLPPPYMTTYYHEPETITGSRPLFDFTTPLR
jgi:hypothetical protein